MESAESGCLSLECVYFQIKLRLDIVSTRHPGSIKNSGRVLDFASLPAGLCPWAVCTDLGERHMEGLLSMAGQAFLCGN